MPYGMYISAAGADVQSRRIEILSNNVANAATPGFKPMLAVAQARHAREITEGKAIAGSGSLNDLGGGVELAETQTLFRQGPLNPTGVPSDLAIQGEGFFVVERGGQQLLTRAGNFIVSEDGRLTTQQGNSVLDESGAPIQLNPQLPWNLQENGTITQEGGTQVNLMLQRPRSLGDLARAGDNLFQPLADTEAVPAEERGVHSGFLEMSAVSPTMEMMQLIEASRAYESNVKMIQNQDHVIGALVNRVLSQK